jgi:hypothetical protein
MRRGVAVKGLESVASYQMGAFDALEYTWRLLKAQKERSGSVDEAYSTVQELLAKVGKGSSVDFHEEISRIN